jgi:hypothetical protein
MIAVLGEGTSSVFFEIGLSAERGKPILILFEPGTQVPSFVPPSIYLSSDLADSTVLRLGIKQFLTEVLKRPSFTVRGEISWFNSGTIVQGNRRSPRT